jgi:hypothetical protein
MPPRIDSSRRSPQPQAKADPYANETHKRIDAILVLVTVVLIAFAFHTAAQHRAASAMPLNDSGATQQATAK